MLPISEEKTKILDAVTKFADEAHGGQMRKYVPQRYIVHPVEVMRICSEYTQKMPVLAAALLHDVLEDTPVSAENIDFFLKTLLSPEEAEETLQLVVELTDVYVKDAFPHLNRRQRKDRENDRLSKVSADAQTIKYADIISNSIDISQHDFHFARVYLKEMDTLLQMMSEGNTELYARALRTVQSCKKDIIHNKKPNRQ